jgi:hypothetical protein
MQLRKPKVEFWIHKNVVSGEGWDGPFKTKKKACEALKPYNSGDGKPGDFFVVRYTFERLKREEG